MDRVLYRKLYPGCLGLAVLFLLLAIGHVILLEGIPRGVLLGTALLSSLAGWIGAWALRRGVLGERHAHSAAFALCTLVLANSLLHLRLTGELHQTTNIMLAVIVGGALLLDLRWWALMVALGVVGWAGCVVASEERLQSLPHFAIALIMAVFVSGLMTRILRDLTLETEIRFRELTASIGEVFWIAEPGLKRILYVSPAYSAIWGQAPERALDDPGNQMERVHPEDRASVRGALARQAAGEETCLEFRVVDADGTVRWLLERACPVRDGRGALMWVNGLTRDVSKERRAAEDRERMERHLAETQKLESLAVLAGGVAHDFNNMLMVILGSSTLSRQEVTPGSPIDLRLMQIERTAVRAGDLCRQMLAYSGQGRIECQVIQINDPIREMADLLEASLARRVTLEFRLAPLLPAILADATQIQQILLNLVVNASEAMCDRGGAVEIGTCLHRATEKFRSDVGDQAEHPAGDYVVMAVSDNGPGMSVEVARRVFEPFFTTKFAGRGLGLAAVMGIVRGHGGAIRVESAVGVGTVFRVLLPATGQLPAELAQESATEPTPWMGAGRVLVVDDQDFIRQLVVTHLRHLGFETEVACHGEEAIERLKAEVPGAFRVILLDWSMPGMDGIEILRRVGQIDPNMPVIVMSGFDPSGLLERLSDRRPAAILQKPFTPPTLRRVLRDVLEGRPQETVR